MINFPLKREAIMTASDLSSSNYPIALATDKFLDFYNDVHSLYVNIIGGEVSSASSLALLDINESIDFIDELSSGGQLPFGSVIGEVRRVIKVIGRTDIIEEPTTTKNYPVFDLGGFLLDFGRTKFRDGIFYPYIEVDLGNGMGTSGPFFIGYINFANYGSISIYGPESTNGFVFCEGRISISHRYSDAKLTQKTYGPESTVTISNAFSDLALYNKGYINNKSFELTYGGGSLSFNLPPNTKSGPILIERPDPYDLAYIYEEIILS